MPEEHLESAGGVPKDVERGVAAIDDRIAQVTARLGSVSEELRSVTQELGRLREDFLVLIDRSGHEANVRHSDLEAGRLRGDIDRRFDRHEAVRDVARAALQAFDSGDVAEWTVQQISEELMIEAPHYWLAPSMVALAAWARDDKALATIAVEIAELRDPARSSLLFALVERRQGRLEAAGRWIERHLDVLDSTALTPQFAVVLDAVAQGAFGSAARERAGAWLEDRAEALRSLPGRAEEQVEVWIREVDARRGRVDDEDYPTLAEFSPDWAACRETIEAASALEFTRRSYDGDYGPAPADRMENRLDDVLERLVGDWDPQELPVRRELAYHQAVVALAGDTGSARERADTEYGREVDTLDALQLTTALASDPDSVGASPAGRFLCLTAARKDFATAVSRFTADYRSRVLPTLRIVLGPDHSNYARQFGFDSWESDTGRPLAEVEDSLDEAWDRTVEAYAQRVRFRPVVWAWAAAAVVVLSVIAFLIHPIAGAVVLVVAGVAAWLVVRRRKQTCDAECAAAMDARGAAKEATRDIFRAALVECVYAGGVYREADAVERTLLDLLSSWRVEIVGGVR